MTLKTWKKLCLIVFIFIYVEPFTVLCLNQYLFYVYELFYNKVFVSFFKQEVMKFFLFYLTESVKNTAKNKLWANDDKKIIFKWIALKNPYKVY